MRGDDDLARCGVEGGEEALQLGVVQRGERSWGAEGTSVRGAGLSDFRRAIRARGGIAIVGVAHLYTRGLP